jgi:hypothetical protein
MDLRIERNSVWQQKSLSIERALHTDIESLTIIQRALYTDIEILTMTERALHLETEKCRH